jgi:hypothetical protein
MSRAPIRLLEQPGLPAAERAILEAGRVSAPVEYDVEAGAARHRAALAAVAVAGAAMGARGLGSGTAGAKALLAKLTIKIFFGVFVAATLAGAGFAVGLALGRRQLEPAPPVAAAPRSAVASGSIRPASPASESAPLPIGDPAAGASSTSAAAVDAEHRDVPTAKAPAVRPPRSIVGPATPRRSGRPIDAAAGDFRATEPDTVAPSTAPVRQRDTGSPTIGPVVAADAPGPSAEAATTTPRQVESAPAGTASATSLPPEDSLAELRSIAVARSLVDRDPEAALGVLDRLRREHPRGYFVEERQALTVLALAQAGRTSEARRQAAAFLLAYPNGPYSERVRAVQRDSN